MMFLLKPQMYASKVLCAVAFKTSQSLLTSKLFSVCGFRNSFSTLKNNAKRSRFPEYSYSFQRTMRTAPSELKRKNRTTLFYTAGFTLLVAGTTYLSVLFYRLYCQVTGQGGQAILQDMSERIANMVPSPHRLITVTFNADLNSMMAWKFKPQQSSIKVRPGETALAFYTATNPTDEPITGIATYTVLPFEAGKYFNKIQCFCFEEQRLNPHEEVDMPVFFFLDPEYVEDPKLEHIDGIILSYTFYTAKPGLKLPLPGFQ